MEGIKETLQERMATIELHGFDPISAGGFTQIPNVILRHKKLSPGAKLTYALFLSYAWQKDSCFPGQETIAEHLGSSTRQVRRFVQELKNAGYLKSERRGVGYTNLYILFARVQGGKTRGK